MPVDLGPANSIIQSYLAGIQQNRANADRAMQQQQFEENKQLAQQHIDLLGKQMDQEIKKNDLQAGLVKQQMSLAKMMALEHAQQAHQALFNSGAESAPNGTPSGPYQASLSPEEQSLTGATSVPVNPNMLQDQTQRQMAALKSQLDLQDVYNQHKEKRESDARMAQIMQEGTNAARAAMIHVQGQKDAANIEGGFRIAAARIANPFNDAGNGIISSAIQNDLQDIALGRKKIKDLPAKEQPLISGMLSQQGLMEPDPGVAKVIDTASNLQALISQFRDAANKYSADSPGNSMFASIPGVNSVVNAAKANGPFATDVGAAMNNLRSQGGRVAQFFDQQNRKSDAEILRSAHGMFDPKLTRQQNLDNINKHVASLNAGLLNAMGAIPNSQKNYILRKNGINPDWGSTGKHTTMDVAHKYAIQTGLTDSDAVQHFRNSGIEVDDAPTTVAGPQSVAPSEQSPVATSPDPAATIQ